MAQEGRAPVVPPQRYGRDPRRSARSRARPVEMVGQGAIEIRRLVGQPFPRRRLPRRAGLVAGPRIARWQPRPEPLLRGHRQAGRRADPRQDLDQRPPARMNDIPASPAAHNWAVDPVALAAELIRRPSVTPTDEGALGIVASHLERLGFTCYPLTFTEEGPNGETTEPVANLYARWGASGPNLCFAGHTDVVPTGPANQLAV